MRLDASNKPFFHACSLKKKKIVCPPSIEVGNDAPRNIGIYPDPPLTAMLEALPGHLGERTAVQVWEWDHFLLSPVQFTLTQAFDLGGLIWQCFKLFSLLFKPLLHSPRSLHKCLYIGHSL